jgi:CubicO group peptidase (beta-lactamase class C family)
MVLGALYDAAMSDPHDSVLRVAAESGFSGVVRIDEAGGAVFAEAFGLAHRGFEVPNTVETQFGTASCGKGFTALAVVSLIVDGALALDTTARSVLGEDLPLIAADVTIEHLLGHRSGIGDYIDEDNEELASDDYLMKSPVHELDEPEAFLVELAGHPTKFKAGEQFSYCNGGFMVLALIAERVSGTPYHDLIARRVLGPAGMAETRFLRSDEPSGRMALGYLDDDGLRTNIFHLPVRGNGDGGIYTTVSDMRNFWIAFFDGSVVPVGWVDEMTRPRSDSPDDEARYGLGFWLAERGPIVRLIGADAGVSFTSSHDPTSGMSWTVISNTSNGAWPMVRHLQATLEG